MEVATGQCLKTNKLLFSAANEGVKHRREKGRHLFMRAVSVCMYVCVCVGVFEVRAWKLS